MAQDCRQSTIAKIEKLAEGTFCKSGDPEANDGVTFHPAHANLFWMLSRAFKCAWRL